MQGSLDNSRFREDDSAVETKSEVEWFEGFKGLTVPDSMMP
jgi:hypothetical protein